MTEEIEALDLNKTWSIVQLPTGKHSIGCRWMYKIKYKLDGSIEIYKARLVAKGYNQEEWIGYTETFSLVVKMTTIRIVLTMEAQQNWSRLHMDVYNVFFAG